MKTIYNKYVLTVLLIFFSCGSLAQETLTLAYNQEPNPPYVTGRGSDIDFEKPGITIEVLKLLGERLNLKVQFKAMPAKRGMHMMGVNKVDGTFHMSFKLERMKMGGYPMKGGEVDSSRKLMSYSYALYTLNNSSVKWDGENITNVKDGIATSIGFSIVDDLKEMNVRVLEKPSLYGQMTMLSFNRIGAVVNIESLADFTLRGHTSEFINIEKRKPLVKTKDYYLMLSKKFIKENKALSEAIWDQIGVIRETGEYSNISDRYSE